MILDGALIYDPRGLAHAPKPSLREMPVKYEYQGLMFDIPDGWTKTLEMSAAVFHGPNWRSDAAVTITINAMGVGTSDFGDWDRRRAFYLDGEGPEVSVERLEVGGEKNALVFAKPTRDEISIVRDGVHYMIGHSKDDTTRGVIKDLMSSIQFPTKEATLKRLQDAMDPRTQALMRALSAGSPDAARRELESIGGAGSPVFGGTLHHIPESSPRTRTKKWWWPL